MTPDEIHKTVEDAVKAALQEQLPIAISSAVTTSVNGKIDGLRKELKPILEAYATYAGSKRLIFWVGGGIIAIGAFITAMQQIVQGASHVMIK